MKIILNSSIRPYSFIKVGGIVKRIVEVYSEQELITSYRKYPNNYLVGNGSKILFAFSKDDRTYIIDRNSYIIDYKNDILIGSGTLLSQIGKYFEKKSLKGFSLIQTIPGRLGGSLIKNASCFNQGILDYLKHITIFDGKRVRRLNKTELDYKPHMLKLPRRSVILNACFKKERTNQEILHQEKIEALRYRALYHPSNLSLGCSFYNIDNTSIGQEIEKLNLLGKSILQGAFISYKHGNFIEVEKDCSYLAISLLLARVSIVLYNKMGRVIPYEIIILRRQYSGGNQRICRTDD